MNNVSNINKAEQKKRFENMMSDLQEIMELTDESIKLQDDILNLLNSDDHDVLELLKSDDHDIFEDIKKLQDEYDILNQKINHLKNAFDEKYPTDDKEWELDERIKV